MSRRDDTHLRSDTLEPGTTEPGYHKSGPAGTLIAFLRNVWRQLTSMRIALMLLFLLALASLPGALLPQWNLNQAKTAQYILDHPGLGPVLNRLGFFEVFASPWYAAIYLLLFISLIGCLVPRSWEFVGQIRSKPVATPRNLARLPHYEQLELADERSPKQIADDVQKGLRGWRTTQREEDRGTITVSAEKGYWREVGNLVFHVSLLGILGAVAVGKMVGFEGSAIVIAGEDSAGICSGSPAAYDNFRPGLLVDGTNMAGFCLKVDEFEANYTQAGTATDFIAHLSYTEEPGAATKTYDLQVNEPLRLDGERVYLIGHGFSPIFKVTFPNGEVRTYEQPFNVTDGNLTAEGAVKVVSPPGYTGEEIYQHQLAIVGIFAPTASMAHGDLMTSSFPAPDNPGVAIQIYRGDLGLQNGSQSVFGIDQKQVDNGKLEKLNRKNLMVGESMVVDGDGTVVEFVGFNQTVSIQTSYDPAQGYALFFAVTLLIGLMMSLTIKRRRVWFRVIPGSPSSTTAGNQSRTVVQVGGLARTDQAGYGEEFTSLVQLATVSPAPPKFSGRPR